MEEFCASQVDGRMGSIPGCVTRWTGKQVISSHTFVPVPSPQGGVGGLRPPKQSSKPPQIETWNTIYRWNFG